MMRARLFSSLILAGFLAGAMHAAEAPVAGKMPLTLTPALDTPSVKLGEPAVVSVTVRKTVDAPVRVRITPPDTGSAVRIEALEPDIDRLLDKPDATATRRFRVALFAPDAKIPPARVAWSVADGDWAGTMCALPAPAVTAVLPEDPQKQPALAEWGEPLSMKAPFPWSMVAMIVAAGAVLGLVIFLLLRKKRVEAALPPPPIPAHVTALEALMALERGQLLERGEAERFFVCLTDIVRTYIEGRFGLRAPEQTTDEFLRAARAHANIPGAHQATLAEALARADLIKFARARADSNEGRAALDLARRFVRDTIPQETAGGGV